MKKWIGLILIAVVSVSACQLLDELRTFNLNYSAEFTVPSSSVINLPITLPTPPVTTDSEQQFENQGVESAWIESVKLTGLNLTITSPQGEDFSFLESVSLYMDADGEDEILIADKIPVPEGAGTSIQLDVTGEDLYPYISKSSFSLRTSITTDETMTQSVDFRADMVFEVKATIPGGN